MTSVLLRKFESCFYFLIGGPLLSSFSSFFPKVRAYGGYPSNPVRRACGPPVPPKTNEAVLIVRSGNSWMRTRADKSAIIRINLRGSKKRKQPGDGSRVGAGEELGGVGALV